MTAESRPADPDAHPARSPLDSLPEFTREVIELPRNEAFSVESTSIWVVVSGRLEIFVVEVRQQKHEGPRKHLMSINEGGVVFGVSPPSHSGLALLATAAAPTTVIRIDRERLHQVAPQIQVDTVLPLFEDWVSNLTAAMVNRTPPPTFTRLEPRREIAFDDQGGAVLTIDKLVWVRLSAGRALFVGSDSVPPLLPGSLFPVSRAAWLECAAHTTLQCFDSSDVPKLDPERNVWRDASDLLLAYLAAWRREELSRARHRARLKSEMNSAALEEALRTLQEPLENAGRSVAQAAVTSVDPLVLASAAVGRAAGLAIKAPRRAGTAAKLRDPVAAIARASGARVRRVILKGQWWKDDNGPLLGFDSQGGALALLPRSSTSYEAVDPATGRTNDVTSRSAQQIKESAFMFYRPFPLRALGLRDVLGFGLQGCQRDLTMIVVTGALSGAVALFAPVVTGIIFDKLIPGADRNALAEAATFLIVGAVAIALFNLTRNIAMLRLEGRMDASIQAAVWDRTIGLPAPFFRNYSSGDLALRALSISEIRLVLTGSALSSILSGIFSVFSFALLYYYSWRLATVATALIAVAFAVSLSCGYRQVKRQREVFTLRNRISGMTLQFINGIAKLRVSATESRVFANWARQFANQKTAALRARSALNTLTVFQAAFPVVALGVIFYVAAPAAGMPGAQLATTGNFLAFYAAFVQFLAAALQLSSSFAAILWAVPLFETARPILESLPEANSTRVDPGELSGRLEMNHINFRYRTNLPLVVKDVSVSISPGEFVAFVGPSGSGKSTLLRLLLGFETPESGGIYFDGQDLSCLDVEAVRRNIGVVLQNGRLLTGDIFTNIVGAAPLSVADAWEAVRLAALEDDIRQMPMGIHTMISEGGGGLSGGQRQRLMIARAIVGKPRILLFDEATSALDNAAQAAVSRSLEGLNATRLVIAHRLSTVMGADRIYVMAKGEIVESGRYSELIAAGGVFAELAKRQLS